MNPPTLSALAAAAGLARGATTSRRGLLLHARHARAAITTAATPSTPPPATPHPSPPRLATPRPPPRRPSAVPRPSHSPQTRTFHASAATTTTAATAAAGAARKACPFCSAALPLPSLVCRAPAATDDDASQRRYCGALQPIPPQTSPYELLGLGGEGAVGGGGWDVDVAELKARWRRALAECHPDRMAGRQEKERLYATQQSAAINRAYETLREPLNRALWLLKHRLGQTSPAESESLEEPALLMEVMELRERLEELEGGDDGQGEGGGEERRREVLDEVMEEVQGHESATLERLGEALRSALTAASEAGAGAGAARADEAARRARREAVALRYWQQLRRAARELEVGGGKTRVVAQH